MPPEARRIGRAFVTLAIMALVVSALGWVWGAWDSRPIWSVAIIISAFIGWGALWEIYDDNG